MPLHVQVYACVVPWPQDSEPPWKGFASCPDIPDGLTEEDVLVVNKPSKIPAGPSPRFTL